jgi:hydroxymethyl cephem carbamoyltransferase
MKILAYNAGHDGCAAFIDGEKLGFAIEGEKDSGARHAFVSPNLFIRSLELAGVPDVMAISGWHRRSKDLVGRTERGYFGVTDEAKFVSHTSIDGRQCKVFHSSHERSHIFCSYGLSGFPQGEPCYALLWEGKFGAFYHVDRDLRITKVGDVLDEPGSKYAFLYGLADPTIPMFPTWVRMEDAGKLMALAAYGAGGAPTPEQAQLIQDIMEMPPVYGGERYKAHKAQLKRSHICNAGLRSQEFRDVARQFSNALFDRFHDFARKNLTKGLPLLIGGGCGLNCEWNTRWVDCGLFSDVFVPPNTNDSGIALGAGIDALHHFTGNAKLSWEVYAGEEFVDDVGSDSSLRFSPLSLDAVCEDLESDHIIAWVQGRYEIGPRALGNRSLLAAPFRDETRERLNGIKQREEFRPIAPICLQEEFATHFECSLSSSPYMLYFQNVKSGNLRAITHVDGSARVQTVSSGQNARMHALLSAFKRRTGVGVLCNTSLNFSGAGFINRMSDLVAYCRERGLDGFVVGDRYCKLQDAKPAQRFA